MTRGLLGIIKLIVFVILLPIIIAVIVGFQKELASLVGQGQSFWWGVISYTVFHLFIFTPQALYRFWQGVFMEICSFTGVAANFIVLAIPIITTILMIVYFLAVVIFNQSWGQESLTFLAGLTIALHIILSGQELYESDESMIRGHYLLNIGLVFIVNMLIVVLLMDLVFKKFSFLSFWNNMFQTGEYIYTKILHAAGIKW